MTFKLTFVINHAAFFASHRLPIALRARQRGYDVDLVTGQAGSVSMEASAEQVLATHGIDHRRLAFGASSLNPFVELRGLLQLVAQLRSRRPDLVHCASAKGVLYGGLAARLARVPALVLSISGMGYAFTEASKPSFARRFISAAYRVLARLAFGHPNKCVVVQNEHDRQHMLDSGLATASEICLIPGSGVHLPDYAGMTPERKQPIVLLPARMLGDKGVVEFVEAARLIKPHVPEWRFILAGTANYLNPSSIPLAQIEAWQKERVIEWLGHVDYMPTLYRDAAIVCLPSYREGMPKVLLEAAAAGCAVVTTDSVGCREAIIDGETGDLVPVRDSAKLAEALLGLIRDKSRRQAYGRAGQLMAVERFSIEAVIDRTLGIYASLLENARGRVGQ
jgi:glycosyltransferase involved in cell wall biosynthesis